MKINDSAIDIIIVLLAVQQYIPGEFCSVASFVYHCVIIEEKYNTTNCASSILNDFFDNTTTIYKLTKVGMTFLSVIINLTWRIQVLTDWLSYTCRFDSGCHLECTTLYYHLDDLIRKSCCFFLRVDIYLMVDITIEQLMTNYFISFFVIYEIWQEIDWNRRWMLSYLARRNIIY